MHVKYEDFELQFKSKLLKIIVNNKMYVDKSITFCKNDFGLQQNY